MDKINELYRARGLLTQAISAAVNSLPNNRSVQEAKLHMKRALTELDNAAKTQVRRKEMTENQFKTWWGNVMSGTAASAAQPVSAEAHGKSLAALNAMISEEQKKLDELEKQSVKPDAATEILNATTELLSD